MSLSEESHDKDCWINAPEGGFIHNMEVQTKRGVHVHVGVPVPCMLSFFYPGAVSESVLCSSGAGRLYAAVCGRDQRGVSAPSHGEVSPMWQGLRGLCSRHVMSSSWDRSFCNEDGQVFLACFQVLVLLVRWNSRGKIEGGWGVTPGRPVKAAQIRERLSALVAPARWRTTKWKSWSARNHRVTLASVSLAWAIHWRGAWSVTRVNFRPRR